MSPFTTDSLEARSFIRPNIAILAYHTTQKRCLLKPALSSLRVYTSSVVVLLSTGSVSLILPDVWLGMFDQNKVTYIAVVARKEYSWSYVFSKPCHK